MSDENITKINAEQIIRDLTYNASKEEMFTE